MEVTGRLTLRLLYPKESVPGTHFIAGWMGSKSGLNAVDKRKNACSYRESNPNSSIVEPVA
jgi:hypothetical protein